VARVTWSTLNGRSQTGCVAIATSRTRLVVVPCAIGAVVALWTQPHDSVDVIVDDLVRNAIVPCSQRWQLILKSNITSNLLE